MKAVRFNEVSKQFGGAKVLDQINLEIDPGLTFGLIGANGAGKTTMIKCLLDFCHLNNGEIQVFGNDHRRVESKAYLSYLPENFRAPFFQTGEEFLRMLSRLNGEKYDLQAVNDTLTLLGFDIRALKRKVRTYSKGMCQKLGLAGCILADKPLLIIDEPMSGLDPIARANFKALLAEQKQRGKTLFFSTHLLNDLESICDRIAILVSGKLQFFGTIEASHKQFEVDSLEAAYRKCFAIAGSLDRDADQKAA